MADENILILNAQSGDGEAEGELVKIHSPLVKAIARSYFSSEIDFDDLVQVGMIGLINAIRHYDVENGAASFKTYASTCIHNKIRTALRKHNSDPKGTPLSQFRDLPSETDVETVFEEQESERLLMCEISSALNECERNVLNLYLGAMSYREISEQLGIEKKKVDNTIYSIKKKIKKILEKK
ncbi:MAG: sigma-70 family RNA polymerase sigma factor [Bacteroides sp.]|nr:sigma-70 family RNA polymerase sigma factor [Bacillota bacterium]MCM1393398.1 sigma-70 family RNA polymerase sigma factor [[Eubacterium] siraeum]MCM1456113.1 sigma-70 family RNA polymerase sigma factor [Bacteroides sp.]